MADAGPLVLFLKDIDPVPRPHAVGQWLVGSGAGWLFPGALMLWILPTPDSLILPFILLCAAACGIGHTINTIDRHRQLRASVQSRLKERVEEWVLIEELNRFDKERSLSERLDPRLTLLINRAVIARQMAMSALASLPTDRRLTGSDGRSLVETLPVLTASAIVDACWMGRHMVRRTKQRKSSFEKRIADPDYQRHALVAIEELVIDLELLAEAVRESAGGGESTIREALGRLQELKTAWNELDEPASTKLAQS